MTLDEFLAWDDARQEERWEFDGHGPVAMVGGTLRHNSVAGNLDATLRRRLRPPCQTFRETLRFRTARDTIRLPDVMVACSRHDGRATETTDPVAVFEILGASTSRTDRIEKAIECLATASIQHHVLIEQDQPAATAMRRAGDAWQAVVLTGGAVLDLPELGVRLPLDEIYGGVALEDEAAIPPA